MSMTWEEAVKLSLAGAAQVPPDSKEGPDEILEWLYLGSVKDATNCENLSKLGINAIFNCVAHLTIKDELYTKGNQKVQYHEIAARDNTTYKIQQHFDEVIDFVEDIREKGGNALVHCHGGISRSSTLVIAYLMYANTMTLREAFLHVQQKRPFILPNQGFFIQLCNFEASLKKAGFYQQKGHDTCVF